MHPLLIILVLLIGFLIFRKLFRWQSVFEWQVGLMYSGGKYTKTLEPGRHLLFYTQTCTIVDTRSQVINVVNQELLCADSIAIKASCSVVYKITDPVLATHSKVSWYEALHLEIQLVLRELISPLKVEEVLARRNELSESFKTGLIARAANIGLTVESGGIKDITFPPDIKKIFNQVVQAEKSAQAMLAKSRAETASLRALANAARIMEEHPSMLALRTLQSVSELSATSGNTIVVALPQNILPNLTPNSNPNLSATPNQPDKA